MSLRIGELPIDRVLSADLVVVGTGVAGMTAALGAPAERVHLLTKTRLGGGSSAWAQGGVAAAMGRDDRPELHARDTMEAGAGLNEPEIVRLLTQEGPEAMRRLIDLGARFDRKPDGELALGREAAHGRRRILHASGDATGAEIVRALREAARRAPHLTLFERAFAWDLAVYQGHVIGVVVLHADGAAILHLTPAVVMATGGCGQVYDRTTNPVEVTGDGIAMAARAGARLIDLEFVQFHPTALAVGADPMPLVTEALRGEGAVLVDEAGRRFMPAVHPDAELAPRDVVARGIWAQQAAGHSVYLDAREVIGERFPKRFPTVFKLCLANGVDPRLEPIPVSPAAHYYMGGIAVDSEGRSSLPGLWACGEAASSGAHGANRLASNSLLEGLVFGARVAEDVGRALQAASAGRTSKSVEVDRSSSRASTSTSVSASVEPALRRASDVAADGPVLPEPATASALDAAAPSHDDGAVDASGPRVESAITSVRLTMWRRVGLVRNEAGLLEALALLDAEMESLEGLPASPRLGEARNLATMARLITTAALARRESRGAHYRSDYPETLPEWQRRLSFSPVARDLSLEVDSIPSPLHPRTR